VCAGDAGVVDAELRPGAAGPHIVRTTALRTSARRQPRLNRGGHVPGMRQAGRADTRRSHCREQALSLRRYPRRGGEHRAFDLVRKSHVRPAERAVHERRRGGRDVGQVVFGEPVRGSVI
jgi:hypothetical protein